MQLRRGRLRGCGRSRSGIVCLMVSCFEKYACSVLVDTVLELTMGRCIVKRALMERPSRNRQVYLRLEDYDAHVPVSLARCHSDLEISGKIV